MTAQVTLPFAILPEAQGLQIRGMATLQRCVQNDNIDYYCSTTTTTTTRNSTTTTTTTITSTIISTTTTTTPNTPCAAEAIYGENSEQTELLREYRDDVLSKTPEGQEIIKTYYKFSPTVTKLLEQRPLLKNRAKAFIDSMLPGIRKKLEEIRN